MVPKPSKKISRACVHCHKTHMPCEEERPCSRCKAKGLHQSCVDAPRKRKKYLMDELAGLPESNVPPRENLTHLPPHENLTHLPPHGNHTHPPPHENLTHPPPHENLIHPPPQRRRSAEALFAMSHTHRRGIVEGSVTNPTHGAQPGNPHTPHNQPPRFLSNHNPQNNRMNNRKYPQARPVSFVHSSSAFFQSEPPLAGSPGLLPTAPLEAPLEPQGYSLHQSVKPTNKFLSSAADMEYATLSSIIQETGFGVASDSSTRSPTYSSQQPTPGDYTDAFLLTPAPPHSRVPEGGHGGSGSGGHGGSGSGGRGGSVSGGFASGVTVAPSINQHYLGADPLRPGRCVTFPEMMTVLEQTLPHSALPLSFSIAFPTAPATESTPRPWGLRYKKQEDIYTQITKPFLYTAGYHELIAYLKTRFAREALIRMAQCMAAYRPSFIACTNSLTEHDLIFMEQCFQRTLLEYNTFIKVSGTPTVVWRRTAQISYVDDEFCILTGWTKEALVDKVTFIVELMDDQSVLEYFDLFSRIAFGDFRGATMLECTLLTPEGRRIRTACIWTLKRDVFGIPMMIVGNFLPIVG